VAVGTLFSIFLGAWLMLRRTTPGWPLLDAPATPVGLWWSTALLLLTSALLERAVRLRRAQRARATSVSARAALLSGSLFLCAQAHVWSQLQESGYGFSSGSYATLFFSMTGLHALHVLGGLVQLVLVERGLALSLQSGARRTRLEFCALYWHFLGLLWLVLLAVLTLRG